MAWISEPFAKFASRWDFLPGRVVIPGSAGVPPAQDLAGSWRLASQGWSVHLPTGAGTAPLQECGRDARAPRGKPPSRDPARRHRSGRPRSQGETHGWPSADPNFANGSVDKSLSFPFSFPSWPFADPVPDPRRIPLESPPTPSCPFADLRAPSWTSLCLCLCLFPFPLSFSRNKDAGGTPALPGGSLWADRADPNFAEGSVDKSFSFPFSSWSFADPFPTLAGSLSNPRQPLRAPSRTFVPLRGQVFAFVFVFFLFLCLFQGIRMRAGRPRSQGDPFGRTVQIRILQKAPWISLFLFPFLPGPSRTPSRPSADPSRSPANPFVVLRGPSCPFVDKSLPLSLSFSFSFVFFKE